jgi:hypothetical protein
MVSKEIGVQGKNTGKDMLDDGVGAVGPAVTDNNAEIGGRLEVDTIGAGSDNADETKGRGGMEKVAGQPHFIDNDQFGMGYFCSNFVGSRCGKHLQRGAFTDKTGKGKIVKAFAVEKNGLHCGSNG